MEAVAIITILGVAFLAAYAVVIYRRSVKSKPVMILLNVEDTLALMSAHEVIEQLMQQDAILMLESTKKEFASGMKLFHQQAVRQLMQQAEALKAQAAKKETEA